MGIHFTVLGTQGKHFKNDRLRTCITVHSGRAWIVQNWKPLRLYDEKYHPSARSTSPFVTKSHNSRLWAPAKAPVKMPVCMS